MLTVILLIPNSKSGKVLKFSKNIFQGLEFKHGYRKMFFLFKSGNNIDSMRHTLKVNHTHFKRQCWDFGILSFSISKDKDILPNLSMVSQTSWYEIAGTRFTLNNFEYKIHQEILGFQTINSTAKANGLILY